MPRQPLFAAALLPAALLTVALASPAAAQERVTLAPPLAGTRLDVSASGEVRRTPDLATVTAGVVTQAGTAARAMADNAGRMTATIAALKRAGIDARDIRTDTLRLAPQYRYQDGQAPVLTGYQATNQVAVRFRDIARTGTILDALVAAGANQIDGPALSLDRPDAALDEARGQALATARARADLYARAAGLRVRRIVRIAEAGTDDNQGPRPVFAMAMRKSADATPVEAGEQTLRVTLAVTFELE